LAQIQGYISELVSTVKGDEIEEDKFKTDEKEFFTLRDESAALNVHVLPLTVPLHTSILFFLFQRDD